MPVPHCNLSIVSGVVGGAPVRRTLPSGDELVQLDLSVRADGQPAASVPVVATPAVLGGLEPAAGDPVVVVGVVRRRFFRVGGATQSRTEVVAEVVVAASRGAAARRAIDRAVGRLNPAR